MRKSSTTMFLSRFVLGALIASFAIAGCSDTDKSEMYSGAQADETLNSTFGTYVYAEVEDLDQHVIQQFAVSADEVIYCGPQGIASAFDSETGCKAFNGTTSVVPKTYEVMVGNYLEAQDAFNEKFVAMNEFATFSSALTLQPGVTGQDCYGPSGPRYSTWCGDVSWTNPETGALEAYDELWFVATFITDDGECLLVPIADPCGLTPNGHPSHCVFNPNPSTPSDIAVCEENVECSADAECNDGDLCTIDSCGDNGWCEYSVETCDDDNQCTVNACDPTVGCTFDAAAKQGESCDDGDLCTTDDACNAGVCEAEDLDCDDNNECTLDSCTNGVCIQTPQPSLACDDGDLCTAGDACDANGECLGAATPVDDGNSCTLDYCDADTGAVENDFLGEGAVCVLPNDAGAGVCDENMTCSDDYCVFTDQEIADGLTVKYDCPDLVDDQGVSISTHRFCELVDGTSFGLWQVEQECGPSTTNGAVKCLPGPGCVICADGYCDSETDCADGIDNDGDTFVDCDDPECGTDPACLPPTSWCDDATIDPLFPDGQCVNDEDLDTILNVDTDALMASAVVEYVTCMADPACVLADRAKEFANQVLTDLNLTTGCDTCVAPLIDTVVDTCLPQCIDTTTGAVDTAACLICVESIWTVEVALCTGNIACLPTPAPMCTEDLDCDDGDDGTTDTCEAPGYCEHTPVTPLYGVNDLLWTLAGDVNEEISSIDSVNVHGCNVPYTIETLDSALVIAFATDPAGCRVNVLLTHNTQGTVYSPSCWPNDWTNYSSIPSASYPDSDDDGIADACGLRSFGTMARYCDAAGTDVPVVPNTAGDGTDFLVPTCN